jgi:Cys-tRNA(Pro) deacylase
MSSNLSKSAHKVQQAIENCGFDFMVKELPGSTRSAADAAQTIGCEVSQIVKSLIFKDQDQKAVLVLASGSNQVDLAKLEAAGSGQLEMADANFARDSTGFAIGGVPPFGHVRSIPTYIDQDLLVHDTIWAAAGTPNAVFALDPGALVAITRGVLCDLSRD